MFPHAGIWAPTQVPKNANWDYGLSLGEGKIFILEDKGTTAIERKRIKPLQTHRIHVDRDQLRRYCNEIEPDLNIPVYYVLPSPPWSGMPTGAEALPDQALSRIDPVKGRFESWAYVVRCTALRARLQKRASIDTDELPFDGACSLAEFIGRVQDGQVGKRVSTARLQRSTDLEKDLISPENGMDLDRETRVGSPLAVFIPDEDM